MKNEVAIIGIGLHKFGSFPDKSVEDLGREAGMMALEDAGVDFKDIEAGFCCHVQQAVGTESVVFGQLGMTGIPVTRVECACASSARGVHLAAQMIAAGIYDMCMIIGVEKMDKGMVDPALGGKPSYEQLMGMAIVPSMGALSARRHMELYGTTREQLAQVVVKATRNAAMNPYAKYQTPLTLEEVLNARMVADPLTVYQCTSPADGASAVIVSSKKKAKQYTNKPVYLSAWTAGTHSYTQGHSVNIDGLLWDIADVLAKKAYEMAGVGPEDIDVAQIHCPFSEEEIRKVEKIGFCPVGEGGRFIWEGHADINGSKPTNTDGGTLGRAHPLGATGGAMIAEIVTQLRGKAGARQVKNPKAGLVNSKGNGNEDILILHK
jgi:benzoylsuccinyl-CoA thiolase BbsB subunit